MKTQRVTVKEVQGMVLESCKRMLGKGVLFALALLLVAGFTAIPADAAMEPGDPGIGERLFTGQQRLTNGAPPCISCHSAGVGALGGGKLGPNLTKVYADPSKNPLLNGAWINAPMDTPMGPIFSNRPVTDEEVGNLRAFFEQASKKDVASSKTGLFTIIGLGGFIGILIVFNIIWAGRYRSRNKGTAHDALWRNYGGKGGS